MVELKSGIFFDTNYLISKENGNTKIAYSIEPANADNGDRVVPLNILNKLMQKIMLIVFSRKMNEMIIEFKKYCEHLTA